MSTLTLANLTGVAVGYSRELAKRLMDRKCLWLVRMSAADIQRIHEADLMSTYVFQGLDLVELSAVYAAIPAKFSNDAYGRKVREQH